METFKRFIKINGITDLSDINLFKINHSFSREFPMILDGKLNNLPEDFSLPFRKCFVDFKRSYVLQVDMTSLTIDSLLVEEVSPTVIKVNACFREYLGYDERFFYSVSEYHEGKPVIDYSFQLNTPDSVGKVTTFHNVITSVLEELCSRKYVYVENNEKIDVKFRDKATRKLNRVKYTPKMIIYISDKKTFKNEHLELSGRIISKPSFSYECMGHWRRLHNQDSLGKNREGEYLVEGFTWVIPHVRCADRGELIKKIRVIK